MTTPGIDLDRARKLNDREPPENLIRSGCARVLVSDLIAEVGRLRRELQEYKDCPKCGKYRFHRHANEIDRS